MLLGRMGKHDEALRIYVSRLEDFASAEAYVHDHPSIADSSATVREYTPP